MKENITSIPKFKFPKSFCLNPNPNFYRNRRILSLLDEIIIPYINSERESLDFGKSDYLLLVMDLFIGEKRTSVREKLKRNNILSVRIPANMTNLIQPLDLTVFDLT